MDEELTQLQGKLTRLEDEYDTRAVVLATEYMRTRRDIEARFQAEMLTLQELHDARIAQLRQDAESNIHPLLAEMSRLQEARNRHAPVARLPPELLADIFLRVRGQNPGGDRRWMDVVSVCQSWRTAALACSELWTTLHTDYGLRLMYTVINRSGKRPLDVTVDIRSDISGEDQMQIDCAVVIFQNISRIRTLNVTCTQEVTMGMLLHALTQPAPVLISLVLKQATRMPCVLPPKLFDGQAPLLRTVSILGSWRIALPQPAFSSLQRIHVSPVHQHFGFDFGSLSNLLETTSNLEYLDAAGERFAHMLPQNPIPLTKLYSLRIEGMAEIVHKRLRSVQLPPSTRLDVFITGGSASALRTATEQVAAHLRSAPVHHAMRAVQVFVSDDTFKVSGSVDIKDNSTSGLEFQVSPSSSVTNLNREDIEMFWKTLPFDHTRTMVIYIKGVPTPVQQWKAWLSNMTTLKHLMIRATSFDTFVSALCEENNVRQTPPALLPELRSLVVYGANFERTAEGGSASRSLVRLLDSRRSSGAAITLVHLRGCTGLTPASVAILRSRVSNFTYDGESVPPEPLPMRTPVRMNTRESFLGD
jgi:hypothetical protein